ncbi:MAG TPA: tetratricopeptide repeat protein [bacterium]|nr:tetratricopeptide repeat protein [bacterium]
MDRFQRALELLKQHRLPEARQLLELQLDEEPANSDVLYNLGMLCTNMDEPDRAVELLRRCLELDPARTNAYVALGFALSRRGEMAAAKANFAKALELEPDNAYALRNLGGLLGKEGDYDKAIAHLRHALEKLPDDPLSLYGLGLCLFKQEQFEEADKYLRRYLALGKLPQTEDAKEMRREILNRDLHQQDLRPDAVFYCLGALELFKDKPDEYVREVTFEIGLLGRSGLDVNNPDRKYRLKCLPGEFSGLHLVSIMYVGFRRIDPSVDVGMDFAREYVAARKLFESDGAPGA